LQRQKRPPDLLTAEEALAAADLVWDAGLGQRCDTCLTPPQAWDGTLAAQKVLSTVWRLDKERHQKFGAGHSIDILLGKQTPRISQFRHDALSVFGQGKELRDTEWLAVVRQLLAQGLLAVEGDYGTLVLTPKSGEVLYRGRRVRLRHDPERAAPARRAKAARSPAGGSAGGPAGAGSDALPEAAAAVFERLRAWRAAAAKEDGVPAYVVFHDATLRQIALQSPSTLAGLSAVNGVGQAKLAKYGQQILDLLGGQNAVTSPS
jgi:ATP-dependent DNA helicase RecQ